MHVVSARMERRKAVADELRAQVRRSATGINGWHLSPDAIAEYVTNALTAHRLDLLAELAVAFVASGSCGDGQARHRSSGHR